MKNRYLFLDCETGGLKALENPITEVAAIIVDPVNMKKLDSYETYVKPYADLIIEKAALEATQTDLRKVQAGPDYKKVCGELIKFFKSANPSGKKATLPILVGHNIGFDINFLIVLFSLCNKELWDYIHPCPIDTINEVKDMEAGQMQKDESVMNKLGIVCDRLGIKLVNSHGAMADTVATYEVMKFISNLKRAAYAQFKGGKVENTIYADADNNSKSRAVHFFEI